MSTFTHIYPYTLRLNWQAEVETPGGENGTNTETIILTRTPQRSGMDTPTLNESQNQSQSQSQSSQSSQASQLASKLRSLPSGSQSPYRVIRQRGSSFCISGESTPNGTIRLVARSRSTSGQFHAHASPSPSPSPSPSRSRPSSRHPSVSTSTSLGEEASQSTLFSGMELPLSLRSIYSQTLSQSEELFSKSKKKSSQKRRRSSVFDSATSNTDHSGSDKVNKNKNKKENVLPDDTGLFWDDEEKVIYGREKVFSFSGYQLQMISLLGLLYAAARILRLDWVARDFEL